MLHQMRADIAVAIENTRRACVDLVARGAKLNRLEIGAQELSDTTHVYRAQSVGVASQTVAARYCRLCMFDVEFRTAVYLIVAAAALFVVLVSIHLAYF
jgi:hypothetical protein